jgi:hypothetical protein
MAHDPNFGKNVSSTSIIKLHSEYWLSQSFGPINIIFNELNSDTSKPSLIVIPDFSNQSFDITTYAYRLTNKYHKMFIINWRGDDIKTRLQPDCTFDFGLKMARYLNLIFVNNFSHHTFHLLANSTGCMIAAYMLQLNSSYQKLFMANPSIRLDIYNIKNVKYLDIYIAWNIDSNYINEKEYYDETLYKLNYKSRQYSPGFKESIHPDFINDIIQ